MKFAAIVAAYLLGGYLVVRALVELVTIDYGDPASYEEDWGGPSLAGVLAVHCLPGALALVLMIWGARRVRRPTVQ
jgi:hypothetical protein